MSPTLTNWFFRKRNHRRQKLTTIRHTATKDLIMPPNKMKIKITGSCDSDAEKKIPTTTSFSRKIEGKMAFLNLFCFPDLCGR